MTSFQSLWEKGTPPILSADLINNSVKTGGFNIRFQDNDFQPKVRPSEKYRSGTYSFCSLLLCVFLQCFTKACGRRTFCFLIDNLYVTFVEHLRRVILQMSEKYINYLGVPNDNKIIL